jgi:hypothetical protein
MSETTNPTEKSQNLFANLFSSYEWPTNLLGILNNFLMVKLTLFLILLESKIVR